MQWRMLFIAVQHDTIEQSFLRKWNEVIMNEIIKMITSFNKMGRPVCVSWLICEKANKEEGRKAGKWESAGECVSLRVFVCTCRCDAYTLM